MKEYIICENADGKKITVRDVQLVLLDMLKDIDVLCRKHHISYCLIGGSALGAVRHKGFIPWDDDADIAMSREDYERFVKVVHELGDEYEPQNFDLDERYNVVVPMKVRKKGTYCEEITPLLKNKCDCNGLFIDVFVYDSISENRYIDFAWRLRNTLLMLVITFLENCSMNPKWLKRRFLRNAKKYGEKYKKSRLIGYDLTWTFSSIIHPLVYEKELIFPVQYVDFEDTKLAIPNKPHEMLDIEISTKHMEYPAIHDQKPKHYKYVRFSD